MDTQHTAPVPKLTVRGISKTFERRGQTMLALDDVSFEIRPGEFLVVVGPSGCGKTTFLRIVQGLDAPTSGTSPNPAPIAASSSSMTRCSPGARCCATSPSAPS
jgi:ABC-type Fe3+/spermidine/putrescine transport system ATPase subunit